MRWLSNQSLFSIHRWIGLNCGVVLFVICLSGTIATLSLEIDRFINPALRVSPVGQRLSFDELKESVESEHPDVAVRAYRSVGDEQTALFVQVESDTGQQAILLVNPYTGDVQGVHSFHSVKVLFRVFHKQFYIFGFPKGIHGTYIVGTYALALFIAGLTGLLFYKRFWKRLFVLRCNRGWDTFWRDSHRLLGVWSALFLLMWSITGIWYLTEKTLSQTAGFMPARYPLSFKHGGSQKSSQSKTFMATERNIEDYAEIAKGELPNLEISTVELPRKLGGPILIAGNTDAFLVNDGSSQVLIDSVTGEAIAQQRAEDLNALDRWSITADPLHFGTFGGLPTKILWCFFGLAVSVLIPIGATIWYRRTSKLIANGNANSKIARRSRAAKIASITWTTVILGLAGFYTFILSPPRIAKLPQAVEVVDLGEFEIGSQKAKLSRIGSTEPEAEIRFRLHFPKTTVPDIKKTELKVGESENVFKGSSHFYHSKLKPSKEWNFDDAIVLSVQSHDGSIHKHEIIPEVWTAKGEMRHSSIQPSNASPIVTTIFVSYLIVILGFTSIWFWKIG